jgi:hypothetical protein
LTNNSEIFSRGRNSTYYYEVFEVIAPLGGDYIFKSDSSMNTTGLLYTENFYPATPNLNLFLIDQNRARDGQFQINAYLQPNKRYILVVTTFIPSAIGTYTLLVSGSNRFNLTHINSSSIVPTTTSTSTLRKLILFISFYKDYPVII